ncbi:MAG: calcium/sodium antiporter [Aquiluna sp.]|nr:calcium/sodium antiporter [Aquiluna sp.]
MELTDFLLVIAGLVLLAAGGEGLVRGASTIATKLKLSPLIIGLVVVSAATSAPELAVTMDAVAKGESGLAVGNVIGSNIINILVILGISGLISPVVIKRRVVSFDIPVMVGLTVLLLALSLDGNIGALDGALLLAGLVFHIVMSITVGRKYVPEPDELPNSMPLNSKPVSIWLALLLLVAGIGLLVAGAQMLVTGATSIATALGVSDLVIGLTVVAIGTSFPELATVVVAIRRGEKDMAVGNIVGSNIFNIGLVLGLPAVVFEGGISVPTAAIALDMPLMLATAIALLPVAFTGFIIRRWEGGLFVSLYLAYTLYVVLASTEHDAAEGFTSIMLWFALPLVAATLVAITSYEIGIIRGRKQHPKKKLKTSPKR